MGEVMKMIPGMGGVVDQMGDMNPEDDMRRIEGIINSMTLDEREQSGQDRPQPPQPHCQR